MTGFADRLSDEMKTSNPREIADGVLNFIGKLPEDQKKVVTKEVVAGLGSPSEGTRYTIWLTIVGAFALVLLCSAAALFYAAFAETKANATYFGRIETVVTVFTSVLAFLSGLLAPSPVKK
jgi:hypothetical protein